MTITREQIIKKLADKSGYYQRDIRTLLHCLDEVVLNCFDEVTDDEEVSIQLVQGIKCGCKIVPERTRKNPKTGPMLFNTLHIFLYNIYWNDR